MQYQQLPSNMKKFKRRFITVLLLALVIYFFIKSILIVQQGYVGIVRTKLSGILPKIFTKRVNFLLLKAVPFNAELLYFPIDKQVLKIDLIKKIVFFNKELENIRLDVEIEWKIKDNNFITLSKRFSSVKDIEEYMKQILKASLDKKIDFIINNDIEFKEGLAHIDTEFFNDLKARLKEIELLNIDVIPVHIPYLLNLKNIRESTEKLAEFEIVGKYIKNNPLILKYLLIQKINEKTSLTIIPESKEWYEGENKKDASKK